MNSIAFKIIFSLVLILIFSDNTFAYSNWSGDLEIFSMYDVFFDILSFSVAVVAMYIGLQLANNVSGKLKNTWRFAAVSIMLFIILQTITLLSVLDIFDLSGIFSVLKLLMAVSFMAVVLSVRSLIQKILSYKTYKNNKKD